MKRLEEGEGNAIDLSALLEEDETSVIKVHSSPKMPLMILNATVTSPIDMCNDISHKSDSTVKSDGVVLRTNTDEDFLNPNNISPILKSKAAEESYLEQDEEYDDFPNESMCDFDRESAKRKRIEDDSFDDISLLSMNSTVTSIYGNGGVSSSKKPKLIRTGSLTKNLRRSMSFGIIKTPINNMFRSRRHSADPNASTGSIVSIEKTFNESIKKPIKEKFLQIKDKVSKLSKKEIGTPKSVKTKALIASSNLDNLQSVCTLKTSIGGSLLIRTPEKSKMDATEIEFKTPKAPRPSLFPSTPVSIFSKSHLHNMTAQEASSSTKVHKLSFNNTLIAETKPVLIDSLSPTKKNHR